MPIWDSNDLKLFSKLLNPVPIKIKHFLLKSFILIFLLISFKVNPESIKALFVPNKAYLVAV